MLELFVSFYYENIYLVAHETLTLLNYKLLRRNHIKAKLILLKILL